jgi:hypothetical protein
LEFTTNEYAAIEIKLSNDKVADAVKNLINFKNKMIKNGTNPPKFLAVIVGLNAISCVKDGVYIIPYSFLKD